VRVVSGQSGCHLYEQATCIRGFVTVAADGRNWDSCQCRPGGARHGAACPLAACDGACSDRIHGLTICFPIATPASASPKLVHPLRRYAFRSAASHTAGLCALACDFSLPALRGVYILYSTWAPMYGRPSAPFGISSHVLAVCPEQCPPCPTSPTYESTAPRTRAPPPPPRTRAPPDHDPSPPSFWVDYLLTNKGSLQDPDRFDMLEFMNKLQSQTIGTNVQAAELQPLLLTDRRNSIPPQGHPPGHQLISQRPRAQKAERVPSVALLNYQMFAELAEQETKGRKIDVPVNGVWGADGVYPAQPRALYTPSSPLGQSVASFDLKQPSMSQGCRQSSTYKPLLKRSHLPFLLTSNSSDFGRAVLRRFYGLVGLSFSKWAAHAHFLTTQEQNKPQRTEEPFGPVGDDIVPGSEPPPHDCVGYVQMFIGVAVYGGTGGIGYNQHNQGNIPALCPAPA
ncbi:hypothetical protein THAOC_14968, partial [Thalassiosira oceanica]